MKTSTDTTYLSIKCAILFAYYYLLQFLGLGWDFKFYSFLILTPIVKFFYFNKLSTNKDLKIFIASMVTDYVFGTIFYRYLIFWGGAWLSLFPLFAAFWTVLSEYLQFLFLKEKDDNYLVLLSKDPKDAILLVITTGIFLWAGLNANYDQSPISPWTFLFWVALMVIVDFIFGFFHYWCHSNPYLLKKHLLHHEYKKDQLNCIAVFYSDILDSILMNTPGIGAAIAVVLFSGNIVTLKETIFCALYTHHMYPTNQLTLMFFFEFELVDMIMKRVRLADHHHEHHQLVDQNFSVFGLVDDRRFVQIHSYLKKVFSKIIK